MAGKFKKLTRKNCRNLPKGRSIQEHGVIFERLANGDGRYSINIMVDGKRIHRVVGVASEGTTLTQAEHYVTQIKQEARENRLKLPKGRKVGLSFADVVDKYLKKLEEEGGKNIPKKRERFRLHIIPFFKDQPLPNLSGFDIERYKKHRGKEGAAKSTVNRELAALSHLFSKAEDWGWIDKRPAKIKRYKEDTGRITYLTVDQIARLIEKAKRARSPHIYPFIVIGLGTCMRRMEILTIKLENIDLEKRIIFIPQAKAGPREQPITAEVAQFLKAYTDSADDNQVWLFPSPRSKTGHLVNIARQFRLVVERAGMDPDQVVRHTLRHTAITHLVQAGVDLPTVKRISGHKTLAMVERYCHQHGDHIQAAMDKLEGRYKLLG